MAGRPGDPRVGSDRRAPLLALPRDLGRGRARVDGGARGGPSQRGPGAPHHDRDVGPGGRMGSLPGRRRRAGPGLRVCAPVSHLPGGDLPRSAARAPDDARRRLRDGARRGRRTPSDGARIRRVLHAVRSGSDRRLRPAPGVVEPRARRDRLLRLVLDGRRAGCVRARPVRPPAARDAVRRDRLARGPAAAGPGPVEPGLDGSTARPRRPRRQRPEAGAGGDRRAPRVRAARTTRRPTGWTPRRPGSTVPRSAHGTRSATRPHSFARG